MRLNAILIALAALLSGTGLCAGETLEYDVAGIFPEFMPDTQYTAPNQPFELRFSLDSHPIPESVTLAWFTVSTSLSETVGSRPELDEPVELEFYGGYFPTGGLSILFHAGQPAELFQLGWGGDHLFTGDLDSPVLEAGTFQLSYATTATVTPTPEPAVTAACAVILIGLLIARRRMKKVNLRKSYAGGSRELCRSNRPPQ
jgi:hypothetical protein